jgi:hypothetical protein
VTYFLDRAGVIRDVVSTDALGEARDYDSYSSILASY